MSMPLSATFWTVDLVHALPDTGQRHECIDGVLLVSPAPKRGHQWVLGSLQERIAPYVRAQRLGRTTHAPADVIFSDVRLVQPDLFVERYESTDRAPALLLVIEAVSPSTARVDRGLKRRTHLQEGVPEYWVVDPAARTIECWRHNDELPSVHGAAISWHPAGARVPLTLDLAALFREALDDA